MSEKTPTINPSEGMDRSVYSKFIAWAKGDRAQTVAALLLILGSLIYQVWQDPEQLEFIKIIAILFISTAIVEEFFELKGKNVDLEKDKVGLEKDKINLERSKAKDKINLERDKLTLSDTVMKIEKALQARFIKNKHSFHYEVTSLLLDKIEDYLGESEINKTVIKSYKDMIGSILGKSKKYAGMITNEYKEFLDKILDEREQNDVPISEFNKLVITDKLTQSKKSEYSGNVEENKDKIDDFNNDHTNDI